ncbi:hypothetical protein ABT095_37705 [Kitasatospora sp. NPDC002227]|uniref:hypothetical protein n=1 Tax=Kitasatospora sp. NPDC002227 TaxID=3154773 RepID=UPI0033279BA5
MCHSHFQRASSLVGLQDFPTGACLDSSLLLTEYLKDHGLRGWKCLAGERPYKPALPESHAWLERDGLIVDITSDQFEDSPGPAVWVTRDRTWHAQFRDRYAPGLLLRPEDDERLDAYTGLRDADRLA